MNWLRGLRLPRADFMGTFGLPVLERSMVMKALGCFGVAVLPHTFHLTPWILLLAGIVVAWRVASLRKLLRLPPGSFFAAAIPVLVLGVAVTYGTVIGRDGGTALLVGFFCLKMLELRNRKDFLVVTGVSYALILAAVLFTQSLPMCLYLLFQFVFTTSCLVRLHGRWGERPQRTAMRLAGSILLRSLPLAAILFLFFPRLDAQLRFSPFDPASGFAESMSPGSVVGATGDRSMAFRVEFPDGDVPPQEDLYWRGVVLARTEDGMAWERIPQGVGGQVPRMGSGTDFPEGWVRYEISLIPSFQRWVFALDYPRAWPSNGEMHVGGVVGWPYKIRSRLKYSMVSQPGYLSREMTPGLRRRYLQLPKDSEITGRMRDLVAEWRRSSATDQQVLERALGFFREQGFAYSFRPGNYRRKALDTFLFERRRGFCEHYSGSLATLMRLAGIPSRVVLGFHGGEINPYGDFLLVRKQNAHSWVEVWLDETGWVRVDPTSVVAPVRLTGGFGMLEEWLGQGWLIQLAGLEFELFPPGWLPDPLDAGLETLTDRIDNLNRIWDEWLGYDFGAQVRLMRSMGVEQSPVPGLLGLMAGAGGLVLLFLAWWTWRGRPEQAPEDRYLAILCRKFRRHGIERKPSEGVATFLQRIGKRFPEKHRELESFSRDFHEIKFRLSCPDRRQRFDRIREVVSRL